MDLVSIIIIVLWVLVFGGIFGFFAYLYHREKKSVDDFLTRWYEANPDHKRFDKDKKIEIHIFNFQVDNPDRHSFIAELQKTRLKLSAVITLSDRIEYTILEFK